MSYFDKFTQYLMEGLQEAIASEDKDDIAASSVLLSTHFSRKNDKAYSLVLRMIEQSDVYDPYGIGMGGSFDYLLYAYNDMAGDDYKQKLKLYKQVKEWEAEWAQEPTGAADATACRKLADDIIEYIISDIEY